MPPSDPARWTTTLTASYLAITAALIAILGNAVPGRVWLVAVHLILAGSLMILNRARSSTGILRVIRDWHPLMLFPLFYKEVELLAAAIGDWRLSAVIPAWESAVFGGQPSLYLSERLAFVPLSEYLHFSYLSYVIVIPSVAAYWYISGRRAAFGELLLTLSTVLLGSYLFFILLPVDSPYYLSPRLGPPLSGHFFFDLVHHMSARGGARGGAFPSAHVSGAVVVSLVAWRHQRRLAYLLVLVTGSVMIATVYGRFHYVLDTLAGAALAIVVVVAYRSLSGDRPDETQLDPLWDRTYPRTSPAKRRYTMSSKLRPLSVFLLLATLAAAPLSAQATKPIQAIANVLLTMNHFPTDAQKQSLKQLADDKATTAQERVLLQALLNVQHTVSTADKPKVEALLKDPAATDAVKTLATILGTLNHEATAADKAALKKLVS